MVKAGEGLSLTILEMVYEPNTIKCTKKVPWLENHI